MTQSDEFKCVFIRKMFDDVAAEDSSKLLLSPRQVTASVFLMNLKAFLSAERHGFIRMVKPHCGNTSRRENIQKHSAATTDVQDRRCFAKEIHERQLNFANDVLTAAEFVQANRLSQRRSVSIADLNRRQSLLLHGHSYEGVPSSCPNSQLLHRLADDA